LYVWDVASDIHHVVKALLSVLKRIFMHSLVPLALTCNLFIFVVRGLEIRASLFIGRCSNTPSAFFCVGYFADKV
jgi:hypothetical protein